MLVLVHIKAIAQQIDNFKKQLKLSRGEGGMVYALKVRFITQKVYQSKAQSKTTSFRL